jgi:hypothetical protein
MPVSLDDCSSKTRKMRQPRASLAATLHNGYAQEMITKANLCAQPSWPAPLVIKAKTAACLNGV